MLAQSLQVGHTLGGNPEYLGGSPEVLGAGPAMAEISLRAYVKEIDDLIEHEQLDEAIAHARHILQTYPRHLDTYRLLGKAYLEAKRFGDSADIMQRVLSAVPDDFVAHVGMSIVREDEGNLEAAIWHMERAFETNPSNAAVQGELRRLIGRRDGLEPHKVRLTRGALARMYAHGELHPQAIAELRAALQEDPERPDLQVLLAEMYWRTNQRAEAGEIAASITGTLPNCREANRILAGVLHAQGRTEEALTYHRRVAALDPYAALVESVQDDPASVDPNAVRVEKLAWRPGQPLGRDAGPPEWAAGMGAEARAAVAAASQTPALRPSWLDSLGAEAASGAVAETKQEEPPPVIPSPPVTSGPERPPAAAATPGAIPDWMQAAGWNVGTGEAREGPVSFSEDELRSLDAGMVPPEPSPEPEGGLARAEIPDWLKDVAPPSAQMDENEFAREESPQPVAANPSGLNEPRLPPGWASPPPGTSEEDDDWLKAASQEAPALPTWMEEQSPGATATIVTWLGDRTKAEPRSDEPAGVAPETSRPKEMPPARAALPEWLADQAPNAEEAEAPSVDAGSGAARPAWLSGVAEAAARGSAISPDEVPWAEEAVGEPPPSEVPEAEAPAEAAGLPDWLQTIAGAESASKIHPRPGPTPEWMTPEPAQPMASPATPREPAGESFGWLRQLAESEPPTPPSEETLPAEPAAPSWLAGEPAADSSRSALGRSAGPEWLRGIAEPDPALGGEQASPPMDWLRGIAEPEEPIEPAVPAQPAAELPSEQDEAAEWVNLVGAGEGQPQPNYSTGEWLRLLKEEGVPARETPPPMGAPPAASVAPAPAGRMDDDQVFDWLEALAAKQSVPAPETIPSADVAPPTRPAAFPPAPVPSPPEMREVPSETETGLDWLDELAEGEAGAEAPFPTSFERETVEPLGIEEILAPSTPLLEESTAAESMPSPEVPDWLKQLVAETPMAELPPIEPEVEAEPVSPEVESWPALPEWMLAAQSTEEEPTVPPLPIMPAPTEAEPALEAFDELAESWVPPWEQLPIDEPRAAVAAVEPIDETIFRRPPTPLEEPEPEEPEWAAAAPPKYQEPSTTEVVEEVPDWLRTPAPYRPSAEAVPPEPEEIAEPEVEIPDWLMASAAPAPPAMTIPTPVAPMPPAEPAVQPAAVLPPAPPPPVAAPVMPTVPVPEIPRAEPALEPAPAAEVRRAEPVPPALPPAAPTLKPPLRAPKPATVKPGLDEKLQEARHALAVGDYRRAAHDYGAVIKKKYQLKEVTSELELALDRNPKASDLWQALGDAYMKGDRLQEAITAYERGVAVA